MVALVLAETAEHLHHAMKHDFGVLIWFIAAVQIVSILARRR